MRTRITRSFQIGFLAIIVAAHCACPLADAQSFIHPGVGLTAQDLNAVKANLKRVPWSTGYAALSADSRASLGYVMEGPFATVSRNPDVNLSAWENDMSAVYELTLMWYFTGQVDYAQKAHDILIAWATTQTSFTGAEAAFSIGDYAYQYAEAADLLRSGWTGWAASDTQTIQTYFDNVFWPCLNIPGPVMSGSQGMEQIQAAVAISIFNDDRTKFNQTLQTFLADPDSGLQGSYPNGEVTDSGRDQGHSHLYMFDAAWIAEAFWKQGVDVYSLLDNRILAIGEYYARYNTQLNGVASIPFIPLGAPVWGLFPDISNAAFANTQNRMATNILYSAYALRKGMSTPWVEKLQKDEYEDQFSFVYLKPADTGAATAPAIPSEPSATWLTTGLLDQDLNNASPVGSASFSDGIWSITGGYNGIDPIWQSNDGIHFAYKVIDGDFVFVAKVMSLSTGASPSAKAGLMVRDTLSDTAQRVWIGAEPNNQLQRDNKGWSAIAYGQNNENLVGSIPSPPYWIKLERIGQRFATFVSVDGANWSPYSVADYANMPTSVYVGLFATSAVVGTPFTAMFSRVEVTGGDGAGSVEVPSAPAYAYASANDGSVVIRWNKAYEATSYTVERATSAAGPFQAIATVPNTVYTDNTVVDGTTYYYSVTASNAVGESARSAVDSATPTHARVDLAASGGTASASIYSYPFTPQNAFDQSPMSEWETSTSPVGWLSIDFGSAQTVSSYGLSSPLYEPTFDPRSWTLAGSNDQVTWETLDTQSAQSFPYRSMELDYVPSSSGAYRYYRLNVTSNNGDLAHLQLGGLSLYSDEGHTLADGTYRVQGRSNQDVLAVESSVAQQQTYVAGLAAQSWAFTDMGGGLYKITASDGSSLGLASSTAPGWSSLDTAVDTGAPFQRWRIVPSGDGHYNLINAANGWSATFETGTERVIEAPSSDTPNQQWVIAVLP